MLKIWAQSIPLIRDPELYRNTWSVQCFEGFTRFLTWFYFGSLDPVGVTKAGQTSRTWPLLLLQNLAHKEQSFAFDLANGSSWHWLDSWNPNLYHGLSYSSRSQIPCWPAHWNFSEQPIPLIGDPYDHKDITTLGQHSGRFTRFSTYDKGTNRGIRFQECDQEQWRKVAVQSDPERLAALHWLFHWLATLMKIQQLHFDIASSFCTY